MKEDSENQEVEVLEGTELVEELEAEEFETEEFGAEEEFEQVYESKKPLGKLITLVAFTAIMLVSSTYAWFSAQKNITVGGLEGEVNVAEGLMVSLDAKNWAQSIDLQDPLLDSGRTLDVPYAASADGTSYAAGSNNRPTELFPVSTTGVEDLNTNKEISFYNGININGSELYGMKKTKAHVSQATNGVSDQDYPGFYAIDLFLQNSSKIGTGETQGTSKETLQLNTNSLVKLLTSGASELTGLQNTTRVALAMYDTTGITNSAATVKTDASSIYVTATQEQILKAYEGKKISDIAIWEPNASTHVDFIVTNNNTLKLDDTLNNLYIANTPDADGISKFTGTEIVPTYALTSGSLSAQQNLKETEDTGIKGIADIYKWNITDTNSDKIDDATGLSRQIALQTQTEDDYSTVEGGVRNLVSIKSSGAAIYEDGTESGVVKFDMLKNSIIKLRMYVWLEGQDVDCTNYASHGGGIHVDLGLVKGSEVGDEGPGGAVGNITSLGTYLPTGFREVSAATATAGLTIADGAGNEYVWVEVPRNVTVYDEIGTTLDLDNMSETELATACANIEEELKEYTIDYRKSGYADTWYDGCGIASADDYNDLKNTMLKSVYQNEGFYVGKYEAGITSTYRDYEDDYETEHQVTETAVVQANAYPFNWVRCNQAQRLASGMASGNYTSSLMFGIQWDLVMRYLESKGVAQDDLNRDSSDWGNYDNKTYEITNTLAKYSTVDISTYLCADYAEITEATPYSKTAGELTLLTTGAKDSFSKMGIYDLAGNIAEWTLAFADEDYPCVIKGGSCIDVGNFENGEAAASATMKQVIYSDHFIGFRPSIF